MFIMSCNSHDVVAAQQWSQVIGGPPGSQTVAGHFNDVSFGSTVLDSYDIVQADVGCPSTTCAPPCSLQHCLLIAVVPPLAPMLSSSWRFARSARLEPLWCRRNQTCTGISQATWNSYMQSVWTAATAQGLDPTSYGATVFAFPNMLGNCWAGLAVIGCYGDYTCWT